MDNNGMSPSSEDMLTYQWEQIEKIDWEMLAHMSAMHRSWRCKQKKRHFKDKSLDDAIASVPVGVDSQIGKQCARCGLLGMSGLICMDVIRIDLNFSRWVDAKTYQTAAMTQMIAPSSDVDAESHTPATPEDAFISVMGKD
ncbi:hypothetical protein Taro_046447 [Colocasia esculenta]|uniref:Uncharacterized protein n=1 Tax=Colocasia esculenta TaxID=4460 RepID=A0A843WSE9_COLES|nr:hypothetical protein [Colocasia esculenta]